MNQETNKEGNVFGLLPILVFLVVFLGYGIITGDFYAMPAIVAFLIALCVAFLQNKGITTIIDMRGEAEVERRPSGFADKEGFDFFIFFFLLCKLRILSLHLLEVFYIRF